MDIKVSASVLGCNLACLRDEVLRANAAGVDMIHFDVMDGLFVNNISFGIPVLSSLSKNVDAFYDVHLMINEPEKYIKDFVAAGADLITFHKEATVDVSKTIGLIRECGSKVGLAIKPGTDVNDIMKYIKDIDMILIMTVEPGFGGQGFIESTLDKVEMVRKFIDENNYNVDIQVDGGINDKTCNKIILKGANNLVSGSYIFNSENIKQAVCVLKGI